MVTRHRTLLMINERSGPSDLAGALSQAGIDVVGQATAAQDTAELAASCRPDTVLLCLFGADSSVPDDFAATHPGLPLVVLADSANPDLVRSAIAGGAVGYLTAPFTPERLLPTLELAAARSTDITALRNTVTDINERLNTRKVVERAKGLLMAHQNLTEQQAFRFIQRTAMDRRSSMRDVANAITQNLAGAA